MKLGIARGFWNPIFEQDHSHDVAKIQNLWFFAEKAQMRKAEIITYGILAVIHTALINRSLAKNGGVCLYSNAFSHSVTPNLKVRQGPNRRMC